MQPREHPFAIEFPELRDRFADRLARDARFGRLARSHGSLSAHLAGMLGSRGPVSDATIEVMRARLGELREELIASLHAPD